MSYYCNGRSFRTLDAFRNARRALWKCYAPDMSYIPLTGEEFSKIAFYLRIVLGKPDEENHFGGKLWRQANVVLTSDFPTARMHHGTINPPIIHQIWDIIQKGEPLTSPTSGE